MFREVVMWVYDVLEIDENTRQHRPFALLCFKGQEQQTESNVPVRSLE